MSIRTMSSKKANFKSNEDQDKVTSFMITMVDQFKRELESSKSIQETLGKLQEFVMVLQTIMTMDDRN